MVSAIIVQSAFYSGFLMKITLPLIYLRVKTAIDCNRVNFNASDTFKQQRSETV